MIAEALIVEKSVTKYYSYDEVFRESLAYFKGDELAATTWINKYAMKNIDGGYLELTPNDMHKRMAKEFAVIEQEYDRNQLEEKKKKDAFKIWAKSKEP